MDGGRAACDLVRNIRQSPALTSGLDRVAVGVFEVLRQHRSVLLIVLVISQKLRKHSPVD